MAPHGTPPRRRRSRAGSPRVHTATEAGSRTRRCMLRSCGSDHADFYAAVVAHGLNCTDLDWIRDACRGNRVIVPPLYLISICEQLPACSRSRFSHLRSTPRSAAALQARGRSSCYYQVDPTKTPRGPPNTQHASLATDTVSTPLMSSVRKSRCRAPMADTSQQLCSPSCKASSPEDQPLQGARRSAARRISYQFCWRSTSSVPWQCVQETMMVSKTAQTLMTACSKSRRPL